MSNKDACSVWEDLHSEKQKADFLRDRFKTIKEVNVDIFDNPDLTDRDYDEAALEVLMVLFKEELIDFFSLDAENF